MYCYLEFRLRYQLEWKNNITFAIWIIVQMRLVLACTYVFRYCLCSLGQRRVILSFVEVKHMSGVKGSQLDAFCHRSYCTVTLNSKFAILKPWHCFQLEWKELFERLLLGRKGDGCFVFLKTFSLETDLFEKICFAKDNHSYMSYICSNFRIRTLIK